MRNIVTERSFYLGIIYLTPYSAQPPLEAVVGRIPVDAGRDLGDHGDSAELGI